MELLLRIRCAPETPEPHVWEAAEALSEQTGTTGSAIDPFNRSFSLHRSCEHAAAEELGCIMREARIRGCTVLAAQSREGTEGWRRLEVL